MTKQEEIREGIRELIKPYIKDEPWKSETVFVLSYEICELLHSQGVVISTNGFYSDLMEPLIGGPKEYKASMIECNIRCL